MQPGIVPDPRESQKRPRTPAWLQWLLLPLLALGIYVMMTRDRQGSAGPRVDYSTFYAYLERGEVESIVLSGQDLQGEFAVEQEVAGHRLTSFRTRLPQQEDPSLLPALREHGVKVTVEDDGMPWFQVVLALAPWLVIVGAWWWLMGRARRLKGADSTPLAGVFGSRNDRFERQTDVNVRFEDVAGLHAAKQDLGEIIDFLRAPDRFERLGGKMPRGVLLVGAPGTGKTLLARAVAGEAGVPFFSITGSEFIEMFVGVGASRVRELFEAAKKSSPAIIFIDEIDAVGRSRGTGLGGGHDEREQTLNQLLAAMDGFERTDKIVVMAATNRPDVLDPALLRPGRFDRRLVVELPECEARRAILGVHARDKPLSVDVLLDEIARATPGYSGADLANLVNEATLHAIRRGAEEVGASDFAAAQDKIQLGDLRETHLSEEERKRVAVHEAGHALIACLTVGSAPLRRVSIIPRGLSLGATQQSETADKHLYTQQDLEGRLRVLLAGYAAERLLLGDISTGAENDLRQASDLAHRMVAQLGMSERLGPFFHELRSAHPFLGARIAGGAGASDVTVHQIEAEAHRLLVEALDKASEGLQNNRETMTRLVDALLEHETLDAAALEGVLGDISAGT